MGIVWQASGEKITDEKRLDQHLRQPLNLTYRVLVGPCNPTTLVVSLRSGILIQAHGKGCVETGAADALSSEDEAALARIASMRERQVCVPLVKY